MCRVVWFVVAFRVHHVPFRVYLLCAGFHPSLAVSDSLCTVSALFRAVSCVLCNVPGPLFVGIDLRCCRFGLAVSG